MVCLAAPQGIAQPDLNLMALIGSSRETDSREMTESSLIDDKSMEDVGVFVMQNLTKPVMEMTPVAVQTTTSLPSMEIVQPVPIVKQIAMTPVNDLNNVPREVVVPLQPYPNFNHGPVRPEYIFVPFYYPFNSYYPGSNSLSYSYSMQYH